MGQVLLTRDVPPLGLEFFEGSAFSPDVVEVEKTL